MEGKTLPRVTAEEIAIRQTIARSIFALPNVEIASHSFRHPFAWTSDTGTAAYYPKPSLTLRPEYDHPLDYREETLGSIDYIERKLAPPGKKFRLMLRTGNCPPPSKPSNISTDRASPT